MRQLADDTPSPEYLQKATEIIKKFAPYKLAELEQNKGSKRALADMVKKNKGKYSQGKRKSRSP